MEQEKYIEMIVDSYDGNLDAEGERLLAEAMAADPSLRETYRLYGEALACEIPVEEADTVELRRRITKAVSFRRRLPLRRMATALSAAAVAAALILTVTLSPEHDSVRVADATETTDTEIYSDSCNVSSFLARNVPDDSSADELAAVETVTPPSTDVSACGRDIIEITEPAELREEFVLATPMLMIEVEYDPAEMLCGLFEMPAIDAGHTRLATSSGFADKLSDIIRMLR
ncbi:MAG: hypothetical protein K2L01_05145 [Rikenellaceae bacterium]|nr:hypothetical protein [Rikenellaceae bacterium]